MDLTERESGGLRDLTASLRNTDGTVPCFVWVVLTSNRYRACLIGDRVRLGRAAQRAHRESGFGEVIACITPMHNYLLSMTSCARHSTEVWTILEVVGEG